MLTGHDKSGWLLKRAFLALVLSGVAGGCLNEDAPLRATTVSGEELSVTADQLTRQEWVEVPEGRRIIADGVNSQFIVALSDPGNTYVLGRAVSCPGRTVVRQGSRLGCLARGGESGPSVTHVSHVYMPLEQPAAELSDADIAQVAPVLFTSFSQHGSVKCGTPVKDFRRVMDRLSQDLSRAFASSSTAAIPVLAYYEGSWARIEVPAELVRAQRGPLPQVVQDEVSDEGGGGGGTSCACLSSGSCPKNSAWPATYCDASNCQSCRMNF